jgi:hypothetical protein
VITTSTRLQRDLNCTGDGLIIGRDGITLNLRHHTITGDGDPDDVGVLNESGHDGVTVRKGVIESFGVGVTVEGARRNLIRRMITSGGDYGITVDDSAGTRLKLSLASGNELDGIKLAGGAAKLTDNVASANSGAGIRIIEAGASCGGTRRPRMPGTESSFRLGPAVISGGTARPTTPAADSCAREAAV